MERNDADDVGEIAGRLGYQLRRLDVLAMEALHEEMAKLGLVAGRATALVFITRHPGCDQTEFGRVLGINRASTMAKVNDLVAMGAVERRLGQDRRCTALHVTELGQRLHADVIQLTSEHDDSFFASLSNSERTELLRLLLKVRAAHSAMAPSVRSTRTRVLRRIK